MAKASLRQDFIGAVNQVDINHIEWPLKTTCERTTFKLLARHLMY